MKNFFKENLLSRISFWPRDRFYQFVFLFLIACTILNLYLPQIKKGDTYINEHITEKIHAEGLIVEEPDIRINNQKLTVRLNKIKVLVTTDKYLEYKYGDRVAFDAIFEKPENFITDNGKEFNYVSYLLKDNIYYEVRNPEIRILGRNEGNPIVAILYKIKNSFLKNIDEHIHQPESSLAGGLLLGGRNTMGDEIKNDFIRTGIIHIVALSGFNVTIVAEFVAGFFLLFFRKKLANWFGIVSIILFVIMVGAQATAIRAGIMATMAFLARATGRTYDVTRGLAIALVIMLIHNPWILLYDVSFQLSFIATIGVIYLTPKFEKYFMWAPTILDLRNIFPTTVAAYIFVLPFLLYQMGNLSLVAIPVNFLILPIIPIAMLFIFLTGFFGFILNLISVLFSYISYYFLKYIIFVAHLFSQIPFASVAIKIFPFWLMVICYIFLINFMFKKDIVKIDEKLLQTN